MPAAKYQRTKRIARCNINTIPLSAGNTNTKTRLWFFAVFGGIATEAEAGHESVECQTFMARFNSFRVVNMYIDPRGSPLGIGQPRAECRNPFRIEELI